MDTQFYPEKDILINYRKNSVAGYMAPALQKASPHFHYQYELLLCAAGEADFMIGEHVYHVVPGSMLFMSNLENHAIVSYTKDYERYTLRFSNALVALYLRDPLLLSIFKQRPTSFCHRYQCGEAEFSRYLSVIRCMEQEYRQQKPYWAQMIASMLLNVLVSMYRKHPEAFPAGNNPESQSLIFNVQNYIEMNLGEDMSLETIANRFFVSKFYLSHYFTQATGYTFKEFVITVRIAKAKDLLITTQTDVATIGQSVGFHNASNFIRTFKKREGLSPLQYRKQARDGAKP